VVVSWFVIALLTIGSYVLTRGIKDVPPNQVLTGRLGIAELVVEGITSLVDSSMGKANRGFVPFIGSLALYLVFANLIGLVGLKTPTSDINTTLGLAAIVFVMIQYKSIQSKGFVNYLKGFTEPIFIMTPMNIFSELTTPISMAFRLYGNMLAGMLILGLLYMFLPVPVGIPVVFHFYFDLVSGLIQTFIFVMLAATYISNAMN